ncbi:S8 family serine peptidase [Streptomyces sp. NPDC058193]|uniref:S8 family serine peptidase n=1 Tax=Streptomyces sp. NPDC058193 TaxID=3346373 RepID=UPI0036E89E0A
MAILACCALVGVAVPAAGAPAAPAGVPGALASSGEPHAVTLVTGDQVLVRGDEILSVTGVDGQPVEYQTRQQGRSVFVVPLAAAPYIAQGRVDEALFDVSALIDYGYDDAGSASIPVLATYGKGAATSRAAALPASEATRTFPALGVAALSAPKKSASAFWQAVTATGGARSASTPGKIWLDRKVSAALDRSVPQIGAPEAWKAGHTGKGVKVAVLDTGWDPTHPDLAGRVSASKDFTGKGNTVDGHGHGTHVASTVGGTGAASSGRNKGVAPDADLIVGKVLADNGSGPTSAIMAGMEWAVAEGADVVSMSLGSDTGGTCDDPLATAVNTLSDSTPTLFVMAAGNAGPGASTVGTPGCARSALTVAAADRDLSTASFSSRGDVHDGEGAHYGKPDITAPGVGIVAARAAGTSMGTPVDDRYTAASGTSMATPHVAGAGAILAQGHPGLRGAALKRALTSSVLPGAKDFPLAQGAGFLDVAQGDSTTLTGPAAVDGGTLAWPHTKGQHVQRELTWDNAGDADVTLHLSAETFDHSGAEAPAGSASLDRDSITVPAHGSGRATLTMSASDGLPDDTYGEMTGRVTATGTDGARSVTAFGFHAAPHMVTLTFKGTNRAGDPAGQVSYVDLLSPSLVTVRRAYFEDGVARLTVRAGTYDMDAALYGFDPGVTEDDLYRTTRSVAQYVRPGQKYTEDATIALDGRTIERVRVTGDRPSENATTAVLYKREHSGGVFGTGVHVGSAAAQDVAIAAAEDSPAWKGTHVGYVTRAYAPLLDLRTTDGERIDARYAAYSAVTTDGISHLPDAGHAKVVDVGHGSAEELAAHEVKDRLVLADLGDSDAGSVERLRVVTNDALERGAVGVLVGHGFPGSWQPFTDVALPVLGVDRAEYALLGDAAAAGTGLRWKGEGSSPFVYNIAHTMEHGIPASIDLRVRERDMSRVTEVWHSQLKDDIYGDRMAASPFDGLGTEVIGLPQQTEVPSARSAFYTTGTGWLPMASSNTSSSLELMLSRIRRWDKPSKDVETWYRGPVTPQTPSDVNTGEAGRIAVRDRSTMGVGIPLFGDAEGHYAFGSLTDRPTVTLRREGEAVGTVTGSSGEWAVPQEEAEYALEMDVKRNYDIPATRDWKLSTSTRTEWTFRSGGTAEVSSLPLLMPRYGVPVDTRNRALMVRAFPIVLKAAAQPGYDGKAASFSAEVSYDDGAHWVKAPVTRVAGTFTAFVDNTPAGHGGHVSLRVHATAADGSAVTQTVTRAYAVR